MKLNTPSTLGDERMSLCEVLDRVLNTGVVVVGEIIISVADVDLIYLGLNLTLTSVETARAAVQRAAPAQAMPAITQEAA